MDDICVTKEDFAQVVRLALSEQNDDVRLYVARLIRKYRDSDPNLAEQLDTFLRSKPVKARSPLRKTSTANDSDKVLPVDIDSRLNLLKVFHDEDDREPPLIPERLEESLSQLIQERHQIDRLIASGLQPTKSAIFVGPPGVGKTLTARWIAAQLHVPLYVLDLTAIMSSFLGRSGSNIRAALDFAKQTPCVLLLDEIDAIAKRRSDDADIGELKRLVTVILQEVDDWQATSLLLAATNHPELIDPAIWRRFDVTIEFDFPDIKSIQEAIKRFLEPDYLIFEKWRDVLISIFTGQSFSDIERTLQRFRRALALGISTPDELVEDYIRSRATDLDRKSRIALAIDLAKESKLSQHEISNITGVSRDTIRKHSKDQKTK